FLTDPPASKIHTLSLHDALPIYNDLGMAVANSLAAVLNGARQVECTINGLGERAGNCALEEVVMALRTRADFFKLTTNIVSKKLDRKSTRLNSSHLGISYAVFCL